MTNENNVNYNIAIWNFHAVMQRVTALETDLADLRDHVAALERCIHEDHVQPPEEGLCQEPARALSLRARVELLEHRTRMLIRQGGTIS